MIQFENISCEEASVLEISDEDWYVSLLEFSANEQPVEEMIAAGRKYNLLKLNNNNPRRSKRIYQEVMRSVQPESGDFELLVEVAEEQLHDYRGVSEETSVEMLRKIQSLKDHVQCLYCYWVEYGEEFVFIDSHHCYCLTFFD